MYPREQDFWGDGNKFWEDSLPCCEDYGDDNDLSGFDDFGNNNFFTCEDETDEIDWRKYLPPTILKLPREMIEECRKTLDSKRPYGPMTKAFKGSTLLSSYLAISARVAYCEGMLRDAPNSEAWIALKRAYKDKNVQPRSIRKNGTITIPQEIGSWVGSTQMVKEKFSEFSYYIFREKPVTTLGGRITVSDTERCQSEGDIALAALCHLGYVDVESARGICERDVVHGIERRYMITVNDYLSMGEENKKGKKWWTAVTENGYITYRQEALQELTDKISVLNDLVPQAARFKTKSGYNKFMTKKIEKDTFINPDDVCDAIFDEGIKEAAWALSRINGITWRFSPSDAFFDLWIHAYYNQPQIQGSELGGIVCYDMSIGPYVTYRSLATRWGWSPAKVTRFFKKLEEGGLLSVHHPNGNRNGTVVYVEHFASTQSVSSDGLYPVGQTPSNPKPEDVIRAFGGPENKACGKKTGLIIRAFRERLGTMRIIRPVEQHDKNNKDDKNGESGKSGKSSGGSESTKIQPSTKAAQCAQGAERRRRRDAIDNTEYWDDLRNGCVPPSEVRHRELLNCLRDMKLDFRSDKKKREIKEERKKERRREKKRKGNLFLERTNKDPFFTPLFSKAPKPQPAQ